MMVLWVCDCRWLVSNVVEFSMMQSNQTNFAMKWVIILMNMQHVCVCVWEREREREIWYEFYRSWKFWCSCNIILVNWRPKKSCNHYTKLPLLWDLWKVIVNCLILNIKKKKKLKKICFNTYCIDICIHGNVLLSNRVGIYNLSLFV